MATTRVSRRPPSELPERLHPRRTPRQRRSRELVDALVEAGSRVLIERGWEGFTTQRVAEIAGVSPGSLYQYFPDQSSLVAEIIERQSEREVSFQLAHMANLPPDATLVQALDHAIEGVLAFQREEGALMRAALRAMPEIGRHGALVRRVTIVAEGFRGMLEARRDELNGQDSRVVTHVLVNALHSLTHDGVLPRPEWLDDEALAAELKRLVRGYLGVY